MDNYTRGLLFVNLNLTTAKLIIFVNKSFANRNNLSLQLGLFIILPNKAKSDDAFTIRGNIIFSRFSNVIERRVKLSQTKYTL